MPLDEAWSVLGLDLTRVKATIRSVPVERRKEVAQRALLKAKRAARILMASGHPDRNPGNPGASERFSRIQAAIASIEKHTEAFIKKLDEPPRRVGFIEVEGHK